MSRIANIVSTGRYIPDFKEVTNADLAAYFDSIGKPGVCDAFIETNIQTRFYAPDDWASSDLAVRAGIQAMERAGLKPEDIDLIVVGTDTPDYITPATATVVQKKLGAVNAGSFDLGCACASFPTGLAVVSGMIATNESIKNVLLIGVYMMRKLTAEDDPMRFMFGDGASAVVLSACQVQGFIGTVMEADGNYYKTYGIFAGGTAEPVNAEAIKAGRTQSQYLGHYPQNLNREGWNRIVRKLCARNNFELKDVDHIIFTQVRKAIIDTVMEDLGLPSEKAHQIMQKWGYLGSACIGAALDDAIEQNIIKRGDLVLFVGSGVGYNQSGAAFRLSSPINAG